MGNPPFRWMLKLLKEGEKEGPSVEEVKENGLSTEQASFEDN
jgi:hypothetical protein